MRFYDDELSADRAETLVRLMRHFVRKGRSKARRGDLNRMLVSAEAGGVVDPATHEEQKALTATLRATLIHHLLTACVAFNEGNTTRGREQYASACAVWELLRAANAAAESRGWIPPQ